MKDKVVWKRLKNIPEYREFKKKSRVRSFGGLLIAVVFWLVMLNANNENASEEMKTILFGGLFFITMVMLYFLFLSFIKKPSLIIFGDIVDIKEKKCTVKEDGMLKTRLTHLYLVKSENSQEWGECIEDYIKGQERLHAIGERVILFSLSAGNTYIIRL